MADISSLDEAINADKLGFDFIGTTLYGYTKNTNGLNIADNDFNFLRTLLNSNLKSTLIVEGKIDTPLKAQKCFEMGVDLVVVGVLLQGPLRLLKNL